MKQSTATGSVVRQDSPRFLTALPVYNEAKHVTAVLDEVVKHASDVLVVDDGSTDGTRELLAQRRDINVLLHEENRGYGAALQTAFEYAIVMRYDVIVTIDCDGQHEPQRISQLAYDCSAADILSGSRYLQLDQSTDHVPSDRRRINQIITAELNERLGMDITDAFCGFKAYCTRALAKLNLTETGYAMPLELWVQAAKHRLRVREMPVPLIYLDEERSFGGALDAADQRLKYYREVIDRATQAADFRRDDDSDLAATDPEALPCS
ncbi:MAG: glycosyltransferase family 2 protein [Planctomycetota bacterium]